MTARGRFISLEGLEGVGKTTNLAFIEAQLRAHDVDFITTREPGGTPLAETLRALVLHGEHAMQARTELLLVCAARVEHVHDVIEPALAAGRWVLSDRYLDASMAYQGGGRSLGADLVATLHTLMGVTLKPDLTLLLDMPVEAGLARMNARGEPDRIEQEAAAFFERARTVYRAQAAADPGRVRIIDASVALTAVQSQIATALQCLWV